FWICISKHIQVATWVFAIGFGLLLYFAEGLDWLFAIDIRLPRRRAWKILQRLTIALGAMSYSLYLLHLKVEPLFRQLLRNTISGNTMLFDLGAIVLTSLGCYGFYLCCERPFISSRRRAVVREMLQDEHQHVVLQPDMPVA